MYSRTNNGDGSFDSRCLHCLMTVARDVDSPAKLDPVEQQHLCVEKALFQLMTLHPNTVPSPCVRSRCNSQPPSDTFSQGSWKAAGSQLRHGLRRLRRILSPTRYLRHSSVLWSTYPRPRLA